MLCKQGPPPECRAVGLAPLQLVYPHRTGRRREGTEATLPVQWLPELSAQAVSGVLVEAIAAALLLPQAEEAVPQVVVPCFHQVPVAAVVVATSSVGV